MYMHNFIKWLKCIYGYDDDDDGDMMMIIIIIKT